MFEEPDIEPGTEVEKRSNGSIYLLSVLGGKGSNEADRPGILEGADASCMEKQSLGFDEATSIVGCVKMTSVM